MRITEIFNCSHQYNIYTNCSIIKYILMAIFQWHGFLPFRWLFLIQLTAWKHWRKINTLTPTSKHQPPVLSFHSFIYKSTTLFVWVWWEPPVLITDGRGQRSCRRAAFWHLARETRRLSGALFSTSLRVRGEKRTGPGLSLSAGSGWRHVERLSTVYHHPW